MPIKLYWYAGEGNNCGDIFGPWLFNKLGVDFEYCKHNPDCISCGSIMSAANSNTLVWGSGVHNQDEKFNLNPSNIFAVRGKLSADKLNVPNTVVGDPGLLLSRFYQPITNKKYKFGIVAHDIDYEDFKKLETSDIPVICMVQNDVNNPIETVANKINECEFIFSSSLHGIIFSHSLGIPAIHIENKPLYSKNNWKFKDYYSIYNDVKYTKEIFTSNLNFVSKYLDNKELYVPDNKYVEKIQDDLLIAFPYASKNK